jgi:hypothetical protein
MLELQKIEATCPLCQSDEVFITGIIAAFNVLLPDIFAVDCMNCNLIGSGYQHNEEWKIEWGEKIEL